MHIGIDFDNTLVCYDTTFYKAGLEENLIPTSLEQTKLAVRQYLRDAGNENAWTLLQGLVYGKYMEHVDLFEGVIKSLDELKKQGHQLSIVSHKTRYPYAGPAYDLHDSARQWLKHYFFKKTNAIKPENVYFEQSKELKLERISNIACNVFIDDLPEILLHPLFPKDTQKILFAPQSNPSSDSQPYISVNSWKSITTLNL